MSSDSGAGCITVIIVVAMVAIGAFVGGGLLNSNIRSSPSKAWELYMEARDAAYKRLEVEAGELGMPIKGSLKKIKEGNND